MDEKTVVLSSSRAIRHAQYNAPKTTFLPNYLTISEFTSKLCRVDGYKMIDDDSRILLLLQASDFKEFQKLKIERNFFTFTKNSSYIFKFFEELSVELYEWENLKNADVYSEYEEHIEILHLLYERYEKICNEHKLLDRIFLPKYYTLNKAFLAHHQEIVLHVDGYLSLFEMQLLQEAAQYSRIILHIDTTPYNLKMQEQLKKHGFEFEIGNHYVLDFTDKVVTDVKQLPVNRNITCEALSEELLQIAFLRHKIYEFVKKGHNPQKIAVILPNESKAKQIEHFDTKYNFNFAMGRSFRDAKIYRLLEAATAYLEQNIQENIYRHKRLGNSLVDIVVELYAARDNHEKIEELLYEIEALIDDRFEKEVYHEEVFKFLKLLPFMQGMGSKSILNLFMQRLAKRTLDDTYGGKITVMGVLESRGIEFDAVVILDFDDDNVPKKSDKDMFLNTKIREFAGLPTTKDRQNLQKHYYKMLFTHTKEVAISYIQNSEKKPSRFLKQLGIMPKNLHDEKEYAAILFDTAKISLYAYQEPQKRVKHSFLEQPLSNTQLKTLLTCKRKYYYRYIQKLYEHEIPKDIPQEYEVGNIVHAALAKLYKEKSFYDDVSALQNDLYTLLEQESVEHELMRFQIALQKKLLRRFCENEIERFKQGFRVFETEVTLKSQSKGIQLFGVIDRIDIRDDKLYLLDYKTGSYTLYNKNNVADARDFQLEFYTLLAQTYSKEIAGYGFYDLKEGRVVEESFFEQKMQLLKAHLQELAQKKEIETDKCEDIRDCNYCPYQILCGRG